MLGAQRRGLAWTFNRRSLLPLAQERATGNKNLKNVFDLSGLSREEPLSPWTHEYSRRDSVGQVSVL
jgi:hypothetical protein